jgi:glycosyltransferase involved in cell wall biosynthesis
MSRQAHILMVHDYPPITGGGLAVAVQELSRLLQAGFCFTILTSRLTDHFADDRPHANGGVRKDQGPRWVVAAPYRAVEWLSSADAVVVHWTFSFRLLSTLSLVLGPLLGRPTVCVIHTAPDHCRYNRLRYLPSPARDLPLRLLCWVLRRCTAVVALSPSHRTALSFVDIPVTHVLPLPVTPTVDYLEAYRAHHRQNRLPRVIGVAGELSKLKGVDQIPLLLRSLTPDFAFRIVGNGPLARLLAWSKHNLPPRQQACVVLLERAEPAKMVHFYRDIDCLLLVSRTESQSRVALEAMLAGVLILARRTSGVADLVSDAKTGFLIDPSDPGSVRDRLDRLASKPLEAQAIRAQARELAERSFKDSYGRWYAFFSDLVAGAGKGLD